MPNIYRLHVRPTGGRGDKRSSFQYCLDNRVLGVGWALDEPLNQSIDWAEYVEKATIQYGSSHEISRVRYFHDHVKPNDLIWTRDLDGQYFLGRVLAPWRYDNTQAARDADVVNVMPCDIRVVGPADAVPGTVIANFRAPKAIQPIVGDPANTFSQVLWNEVSGQTDYDPRTNVTDLFALVGDRATEDLVLLYLQLQGWLVLDGTRQHDTLAYETVLVHRDSHRRALVSVKNGRSEPLDPTDWAKPRKGSDEVFLFQAQALYGDAPPPPNVECIAPDDIRAMVKTHPNLLPVGVSVWDRWMSSACNPS